MSLIMKSGKLQMKLLTHSKNSEQSSFLSTEAKFSVAPKVS